MDETTTPDPATDSASIPLPDLVRAVSRHVVQYREAARALRGQAQASLAQDPPDFSAAATACHRALQFTRQAEALHVLVAEAGEW